MSPDIAAVAALIGERARVAILDALVDEPDLPAGDLAHRAGISASTASAHLAKLVEGGLVAVERNGLVIAADYGYTAPSWLGAALSLGGLAVLAVSAALHRRDLAALRREVDRCYSATYSDTSMS